jgi:hypothetical protein
MVPSPGATTEVAERLAVTVLGSPLVWKVMGLLKEPLWSEVSVKLPVEPCTKETEVAEGVTVKVDGALMVTGMLTLVVNAGLASVAVTTRV